VCVGIENVVVGATTFTAQVEAGVAAVDGDLSGMFRMFDALIDFEMLFEMLPGTAQPVAQ